MFDWTDSGNPQDTENLGIGGLIREDLDEKEDSRQGKLNSPGACYELGKGAGWLRSKLIMLGL